MYFMEHIKNSRKYKIKQLSGSHQPRTDYYKLDETRGAPRRGRHKRASGQYDVELLFVADYSVYQFWRFFAGSAASDANIENFIKTFYAFLANGVDVRYLGINTEPYRIGIVYIGVVIAKSPSDSPWSTNFLQKNDTLDADQVLTAFNEWVINNRDTLPKHDHVMAFTRYNIVTSLGSSSSADIAGYAYQGGICQPESISVVEESLNFISHTVAAHELGHSLGAKHDGNENTCRAYDHYIMEATSSAQGGSKAGNPWRFSSCSKNEMENLLSTLDSNRTNCLKRRDYSGTLPNLARYITSDIGQQYNIHQQCAHIMRNSQSYACMNNFNNDFSTICTGMWCFNPISGSSCDLVVPFDYTACGTGKWCVNGECRADSNAPTEPENCLFGNYPKANCSGIGLNPSVCYFGTATSCCKSCGDVSTGVPGCEYGDRQGVCYTITSGAPCYSSDTDVQCCDTCASFRTQIPSCEYGDRRNCSALTYAGDCYGSLSDGSAARTVCCQTCAEHETGIQDCMYGDKVLDCRVAECPTYAAAGVLDDCCETCQYYIVSTPAPRANSTALPTWVIPVAAGGGGGLLVIVIIIVSCCCCRKSPSEKAELKYRTDAPRNGLRQQNRPPQSNPLYKSEIRQPKSQEYMGPISFGGYSHTYDRPDMRQQQQQQQTTTGLQRQASIDSHVYMELEPDPSIQTGYVVSSNSSDQRYTNAGYLNS